MRKAALGDAALAQGQGPPSKILHSRPQMSQTRNLNNPKSAAHSSYLQSLLPSTAAPLLPPLCYGWICLNAE